MEPELEIDMKPYVKEVYMYFIKGILDRVMMLEIDSLVDNLIHLTVKEPPNAAELLIMTDKFFVFKKYWNGILENLNDDYLPQINYKSTWQIEITPYTFMLCDLTKEYSTDVEIEKVKTLLKIDDDYIENNFVNVISKLGFDAAGIGDVFIKIPTNLLPSTKKEQLKLVFRLMNFPPLGELSLFLGLYNNVLKEQLKKLSIGFAGVDYSKLPEFGKPESLLYSWVHISHQTFKKVRLEGLEARQELAKFNTDFEEIKRKVEAQKGKFIDDYICPCCGIKQEINLPEEILEYKFLLEKQELAKAAGLLFYDEFVENFKETLSEKYYAFLPQLNRVNNPDCIILVEGQSEEASIPLLSFRRKFILSRNNIQVYNCNSKQKLKDDFLNFKKNFPDVKIICLLDADAIKERADIERMIKEKKHKYRCVFIPKGTFEDIFDLDASIQVLNELYPEGDLITMDDFDSKKEFLQNVSKVMFTKKKANFDKVLFAKTISMKIDIEKTPKELLEVLEIAEQFSLKSKFIKN